MDAKIIFYCVLKLLLIRSQSCWKCEIFFILEDAGWFSRLLACELFFGWLENELLFWAEFGGSNFTLKVLISFFFSCNLLRSTDEFGSYTSSIDFEILCCFLTLLDSINVETIAYCLVHGIQTSCPGPGVRALMACCWNSELHNTGGTWAVQTST